MRLAKYINKYKLTREVRVFSMSYFLKLKNCSEVNPPYPSKKSQRTTIQSQINLLTFFYKSESKSRESSFSSCDKFAFWEKKSILHITNNEKDNRDLRQSDKI